MTTLSQSVTTWFARYSLVALCLASLSPVTAQYENTFSPEAYNRGVSRIVVPELDLRAKGLKGASNGVDVQAWRSRDGARLNVYAYSLSGASKETMFWPGGADATPIIQVLPSGFRVFGDAVVPRGRGSRVVSLFSGGHVVTAGFDYQYSGQPGRPSWRLVDPEADVLLLEAVARAVFSQMLLAETDRSAAARISGREVGRRVAKSGAGLLSLDDWCVAKGVALTKNHETGFGRFTIGGVTVIVPLAGDEVKVGSERRRLTAPIVQDDGDWFVDEAFLRSLSR